MRRTKGKRVRIKRRGSFKCGKKESSPQPEHCYFSHLRKCVTYTICHTIVAALSLHFLQWWNSLSLLVESCRTRRRELDEENFKDKDDDGTENVIAVAMDCEMVGVGWKGKESALARCSIVTVNNVSRSASLFVIQSLHKKKTPKCCWSTKKFKHVRVIYDKVVRPTRKVTDYRTEFSGITRDILRGDGSLPVVSFDVCHKEVSNLLSSIDGKSVMIVGHGLENDFNALRISHPKTLVRDTATFPPLMKDGRCRKLPRKLAHLAQDELGLSIQNSSHGHCSVEDATIALQLYLKHRRKWERTLGYPLRRVEGADNIPGSAAEGRWSPITLYLDGCNLPVALRKEPIGSECRWQLLSEARSSSFPKDSDYVDWIPKFNAALLDSAPAIDQIIIMFDGAKYVRSTKLPKNEKVKISNRIFVEVTEVGVSTDDVLVERNQHIRSNGKGIVTSLDTVMAIFCSEGKTRFGLPARNQNDCLDKYVVISRKGGGRKTNKKLFTKLNLRRPEEGALCLTALTSRLRKNSFHMARELSQSRAENVIQCEVKERYYVRSVVVTDDILLAHRLVQNGNIVLNYKQMRQAFL